MGLWADWLAASGQTVTVPVYGEVPCRAERAERVGGGGYYYQDWVVFLEQRVAYGASCTVTGDVARTAYDVREVRGVDGEVLGYKVVLGHVG